MPFIAAGDLRIHYLERDGGSAIQPSIPVVLLHGNWSTAGWWELVLDRLPAGFRALAPDLRGRGRTEGPDTDYSIPSLAADLELLVDALGLAPIHLVGHSLGTAIAMQYAFERGPRVRSLALIAPAWVDGMPEAYDRPQGQVAIKRDAELFERALRALAPGAAADDRWRRLVADGREQRLEAALSNLRALICWHPGDALRGIAVPTLVVSGALDTLTGGANARRAAAVLGARSVVLPGVGHSPNVEAPDALATLLVELWRSVKHR